MTKTSALTTVVVLAVCAMASAQDQAPDGAALYQRQCASCHDGGLDRAPGRDDFRAMTPERVLAAMETGPMISMATGRSAAERRAIAQFVTGKAFGEALDTVPSPRAMCSPLQRDGN